MSTDAPSPLPQELIQYQVTNDAPTPPSLNHHQSSPLVGKACDAALAASNPVAPINASICKEALLNGDSPATSPSASPIDPLFTSTIHGSTLPPPSMLSLALSDSENLSPLSDVPSECLETPSAPIIPTPSLSAKPSSFRTAPSPAIPKPPKALKIKKRKGLPTVKLSKKTRRLNTPHQSSLKINPKSDIDHQLLLEDSLDPEDTWITEETIQRILKDPMDPLERRKHCTLKLLKLKSSLGLNSFDFDATVARTFEPGFQFHPLPPPSSSPSSLFELDDPFTVSLKGPLMRCDFISPLSGQKLCAFIFRDFETKCPHLQVLESILSQTPTKPKEGAVDFFQHPVSIDYVYFQPSHLIQVNSLLTRLFWEGIDVSEFLLYPEFGILALYGKLVIGCALCTSDGYLSYLAVMPTFQSCGIASFLIYWICQQIARDITIHVSANNPAMILYQKFGFKPEEYIVGFYDKYYPPESKECKNAFFLRLRR